jgi:hypothetical protein
MEAEAEREAEAQAAAEHAMKLSHQGMAGLEDLRLVRTDKQRLEDKRFKRESALFMQAENSDDVANVLSASVPATTPTISDTSDGGARKFYVPANGVYEIVGSENDDIRTVTLLPSSSSSSGTMTESVSTPEYREKLRNLWDNIEKDMLKGQRLQGLGTCDELIACLHNGNLLTSLKTTCTASGCAETEVFALFKKIYGIARLGESPRTLLEY